MNGHGDLRVRLRAAEERATRAEARVAVVEAALSRAAAERARGDSLVAKWAGVVQAQDRALVKVGAVLSTRRRWYERLDVEAICADIAGALGARDAAAEDAVKAALVESRAWTGPDGAPATDVGLYALPVEHAKGMLMALLLGGTQEGYGGPAAREAAVYLGMRLTGLDHDPALAGLRVEGVVLLAVAGLRRDVQRAGWGFGVEVVNADGAYVLTVSGVPGGDVTHSETHAGITAALATAGWGEVAQVIVLAVGAVLRARVDAAKANGDGEHARANGDGR